MIHYTVSFSFRDGIVEADELERVRLFLTGLKGKGQVHDFRLLKNRAAAPVTRGKFQAVILFRDNAQMEVPFRDVAVAGIHAGDHGSMIAHVSEFVVEVFEELQETAERKQDA